MARKNKARKIAVAIGLTSILIGACGSGGGGSQPVHEAEEVASIAIGGTCRTNKDCISGSCLLEKCATRPDEPAIPTPIPRTNAEDLTAEEKAAIREWLIRFRTEIMDKFEGSLIGGMPIVPVPHQPWDETICYYGYIVGCKEDAFPVGLGFRPGFNVNNLSCDVRDFGITYGEGNDDMTIGPNSEYLPPMIIENTISQTFEPDDIVSAMSYLGHQLRNKYVALGNSLDECCPKGQLVDLKPGDCCEGSTDVDTANFSSSMALCYWELATEYYNVLWELTE